MESAAPHRARIRRWYVPNAVYFVTSVTHRRQPLFADEANIVLLRETMHRAKAYHPFSMRAYAYMPDHFHLLILVPLETTISGLMHSIRRNFTRNYKDAHGIAGPLRLWQPSFYEHVIRDDVDLERHFDYIHYNPAKHRYVTDAAAYAYTSLPEYIRRGWYGKAWGQSAPQDELRECGFEPSEGETR